ncbi:Esterase B1 [Eumeta japonica]|uniref:Carboxylic ester hydrolase n=1 Tax=Eumeta variegata TaxID=151549 RepID=A0A4C1Y9Q7_EUMVA|nr:Esterase B1 [Eumeta japonica]
MELGGGHRNSVTKRRNPIEFGLVRFVFTSTLSLDGIQGLGAGSRAKALAKMVRSAYASVLLLAVACVAHDDGSRVVRIAQGPVRGYKYPNGDFYAFYGIPYATAPTGPLKFRGPLPAPMWLDTFEAIDKKIICPQSKMMFQRQPGAEEQFKIEEHCLIANVFVPDTEETNLPVVVYVHGGAFQLGFGTMIVHAPFLNSGKIIEVNFNYRVGGHGFLCLGTEDVPGNAGMKDQVAALRWVKNNIASFGGNPDDITLAGFSAGAAAVELLLLSKSARGLFNKVIPESGAGVGVWAVQSDPVQTAKTYAESQGYKGDDDIYALEEFFKNLSLDILQADSFMDRRDSTFFFSPCVERKETKDAFLTDAPTDIIKKGDYEKLPILTGAADMEGIFRLPLFEQWKDAMNENFSEFLPADLRFESEDERQRIAEKIKEFYFGDQAVSEETALGFVNYFSDVMFVYPTHRSVSLQLTAGSNSLYHYVYAFADTNRPFVPYPGITGAAHCDQSSALGDTVWAPITDKDRSDDFIKMKRLLVDVWQNFIITGNPTPEDSYAAEILGEWQPTSLAQPRHALINSTSELRGALLPDRMALWDEIYSKYYFTPIPPPEAPKKHKTEL